MNPRWNHLRKAVPIALVIVLGLLLATALSRLPSVTTTVPLKAEVGKPAPDFTIPLLDGGTFRLSEHRGKVVVLDFWAVYCSTCRVTMPATEGLVARFPGAELLAVNVEETPQEIRPALADFGVKSPVGVAGGTDMPTAYRVYYLPQIVVIDAQGILRAGQVPTDETWLDSLASNIESALKSGQALTK